MNKISNVYIIYDLDACPGNRTNSFKLKSWLFGATSIAKSSDKEKHMYSGYGITFNSAGSWSFNNDTVRIVLEF